MEARYIDIEDLIAAPATPPGASALAIVRAAGPGCLEAIAKAFSRPKSLVGAAGRTLLRGVLRDPESGLAVDDLMVAVFRGPSSPTGADQADLMCHGSAGIVRAILETLFSLGFRQALPGEFSFRAFAAGKADLIRSEAVDELVRARTAGARAAALGRLSGSISAELSGIRAAAFSVLAACEVRLDYGEDEVEGSLEGEAPSLEAAIRGLEALQEGHAAARLRLEGARVAIAGRTNAGKSSLFNRLLREERSIVADVHGTTRDYIEAAVDLDGVPVSLFDTAGLRESDDPVESEGVRRSLLLSEGVDALIYVVDGRTGVSAEDEGFLAGRPDAIRVWNKVDAPDALPAPPGFIELSAKTGHGQSELTRAMLLALPGGEGVGSGLASERQARLVAEAVAALRDARQGIADDVPLDLIALDLRTAVDALGELSGETAGDELLETIFSRFCVGK